MTSSRRIGLVLILIAALLWGCDDDRGGRSVRLPEAQLSFELPPGWSADPAAPGLYRNASDPDSHGIVRVTPLDPGDSFELHITEMLRTGGQVVSRREFTLDGRPAVEIVTRGPYHLYEVYIRDDPQRVVYIAFSASPEDFPSQQSAFRDAVNTIRFD